MLRAQTVPGLAPLSDAVRWWELRRVAYNLALAATTAFWVSRTWPHFRAAIAPSSLAPLAVLALLANVCYSAAYVAELVGRPALPPAAWRRWRTAIWIAGTLLAMLVASYWILDEIYPDVPFSG